MHITIVAVKSRIPVKHYGGTQRDIWALGKVLIEWGHQVAFVVKRGSSCPFAEIIEHDPNSVLQDHIPDRTDVVHCHHRIGQPLKQKTLFTIHGTGKLGEAFDVNSVFVSRNHAQRHGSESFVYNGLDFEELGPVDLNAERRYLLFLGKVSWKLKNCKGAVEIAKMANKRLHIMGGRRIDPDPRIRYHGLVGGRKKIRIIQHVDALLFPVIWHEPQGLAIIESMYFGCPVFGTPYGSLPEIVKSEYGFLSKSKSELAEAVQHAGNYDRKACHEYVRENFSAEKMTREYLQLYHRLLDGEMLNEKPPQILEKEPRDFFYLTD